MEDEDEDIRSGLESLFLVGRRCTMTCVGEIGVVMVRVVVVVEVRCWWRRSWWW